jgi:pectinesterase
VCPRGWCFIKDSKFYEVKQSAAVWHAGNYDPDQKFVIRNSNFDGVEGFKLGRHHYEAQFYLIDCSFSSNMADKPIYHHLYEDSTKNNPYYFGDRKYFYNCTKEGEKFEWYRNNLDEAPGNSAPDDITTAWTFGSKWDPERSDAPVVIGYSIHGKSVDLVFSEIVTVRGEPSFKNQYGKIFKIVKQRFNDINRLTFIADYNIIKSDLDGKLIILSGDIIASVASVDDRSIGSEFQIMTDLTKN